MIYLYQVIAGQAGRYVVVDSGKWQWMAASMAMVMVVAARKLKVACEKILCGGGWVAGGGRLVAVGTGANIYTSTYQNCGWRKI